MNLFHKYGGYRKLDSFTLASVIQLATWRFCTTGRDWEFGILDLGFGI